MPTIRQVYLYEDRNLPKIGWLQGCIVCSTITSHTKIYEFKSQIPSIAKYEFHTYLCPTCSRIMKNETEKYNEYKQITNEMIFFKFGFY